MRVIPYRVAGEAVTIRVVETRDDVTAFTLWAFANRRRLAFDTETTGLDVYARGFRLRLAQFGTRDEAWVLPVDPQGGVPWALYAVREALRQTEALTVHNAKFDALVAARHVPDAELVPLWRKVTDTKIWAHLIDPRGPQDPGGVGTGLEAMTARHIDAEVAETVKGSMTALAKRVGCTKAEVWAKVNLWDPDYHLYAGMDVILASRLREALGLLVERHGYGRLSEFEHRVALVCAKMEQRGFLIDVDYARQLVEQLNAEADRWAGVAARFGITSVNAPAQVSAALVAMGEELTETTDTGALAVGKDVLLPLSDLNPKPESPESRAWTRSGQILARFPRSTSPRRHRRLFLLLAVYGSIETAPGSSSSIGPIAANST